LDTVKRPFLVVHDYGMGGLWAYIWAESEDQITSKLDVQVVSELPAWLIGGSAVETFDIDGPLPDWLSG
jgi:hypothetical protein